MCYLVAAACGALALSTARAARAAGERMRGVLGLGAMSLRFNAVMAVLGLAHHTGQVGGLGCVAVAWKGLGRRR